MPLIEPERESSERRPEEDIHVRPFPVLWRPPVEVSSRAETPSELLDEWDELVAHGDDLSGPKVGGWPQTIQAEVTWPVNDVEFVIQVDSDEKANTGIPGAGKTTVSRRLAERFDRGVHIEAMLAANFFDHGFTVVIDDVIVGRERLGIYETELGARPMTLVVLAPPLDVALSRDEHRRYKRTGALWAHLDAEQRAKLADVGMWLDTAAMTSDETVDTILAVGRST